MQFALPRLALGEFKIVIVNVPVKMFPKQHAHKVLIYQLVNVKQLRFVRLLLAAVDLELTLSLSSASVLHLLIILSPTGDNPIWWPINCINLT